MRTCSYLVCVLLKIDSGISRALFIAVKAFNPFGPGFRRPDVVWSHAAARGDEERGVDQWKVPKWKKGMREPLFSRKKETNKNSVLLSISRNVSLILQNIFVIDQQNVALYCGYPRHDGFCYTTLHTRTYKIFLLLELNRALRDVTVYFSVLM